MFSPSDPAMTSSRSSDSLFFCTFLVRFGTPAGGGIDGAEFCEPTLAPSSLLLDDELLRAIPSSCRGWGTFEMEMDRRRCSFALAALALEAVRLIFRARTAALDWRGGEDA